MVFYRCSLCSFIVGLFVVFLAIVLNGKLRLVYNRKYVIFGGDTEDLFGT